MNLQGSLDGFIQHKTLAELRACMHNIVQAPAHAGRVGMIVCRPRPGERKVLQSCELNTTDGLTGDSWKQRGQWKAPHKAANVDMQLNLMNLPAGTRLMIGTAVIEVTAEPHLGCRKFAERFGRDAVEFVNSDQGKQLNLRGINAKVVSAGQVAVGDEIRKI
jgi:hypothetical protein